MSDLRDLKTDYERANHLAYLLSARATGGAADEADYRDLRKHFLSEPSWLPFLPTWLSSIRTLEQFWPFIQGKFSTYKERRAFIAQAFEALLNRLDAGKVTPAEKTISNGLLSAFSTDEVGRCWKKMLYRATHDPDGAITASRTLLETVLKHILDELKEVYDARAIELPELYK